MVMVTLFHGAGSQSHYFITQGYSHIIAWYRVTVTPFHGTGIWLYFMVDNHAHIVS